MIIANIKDTAAEVVTLAVEYSTQHTEIVTLMVPAGQFEAIRALLIERADDYVDVTPSEIDAWGADDGVEWRVQARAEG